jgi:hypothetical protein
MLIATGVPKMLNNTYLQIEKMMEDQYNQMNVPEETKPIFKKYTKKMWSMLQEEMGWEKLKDDVIASYVNVYSEKELKEITKFYVSPAGRKFVEKMPQLTQDLMTKMHNITKTITPRMKQITLEMDKELNKYKQTQQ